MSDREFAGFLSSVASRLRHDLKGGLISLRMGLEALPDGEDLKPLLIDRSRHLETLSDKLILLLRMGEMRPAPVRLSALLGELRHRLTDRCPKLEITIKHNLADLRPRLDGDALLEAMLEIAENAEMAGAGRLEIVSTPEGDDGLKLCFLDNGNGPECSDPESELSTLLPTLGLSRWGRGGLGLAIAERCALGHGGTLKIEKATLGLRVSIILPRVER